jgi:hypothetical protein
MLPTLFGLASIYYLARGVRPKAASLIACGLLLFIGFTVLREWRDTSSAGRASFENLSFADDPAASLAQTFTRDDNEMFDTMANLMSVVPDQIPYQPLGLVTDILTRALPRGLYPDKPLEVNDQLVVALWPEHYRVSKASAASSIFGLFYLYGGFVGVFLSGLAIGILLNQTWKWYLSNAGNLNAILLYAFVPGFVVILLRGTTTDTLTRMFFLVMPMVVAQRYWQAR